MFEWWPSRPMIYHGYVWLDVAGRCCLGHRPDAYGIGWWEPEVVWLQKTALVGQKAVSFCLGFDWICPSRTGIEDIEACTSVRIHLTHTRTYPIRGISPSQGAPGDSNQQWFEIWPTQMFFPRHIDRLQLQLWWMIYPLNSKDDNKHSKSNNITIDGWKGESSKKMCMSDLRTRVLSPDLFGVM